MNIKDISGLTGVSPADAARNNTTSPQRSDGKESATQADTAEKLTLTGIGQYLANTADEPAPVDRERVEAIQNALADGSYEIDSASIAARLLKLDRELL
jgi:negative regulator of flagellin synthesis FlgM